MDDNDARIQENGSVVMRKLNGSRFTQLRIRRNMRVTVENLKFQIDPSIIGKLFGIYNVKDEMLLNEATEEEIAEYKKICASTAEADTLEDSDQRGNQTKLVREKVQIKQAKRALTLVQIEKATPRLLSELYYLRNAEAVGFLRTDHIGYIMEMSGIIPGSKVIIFDQCSGLITAHVVERLGGNGVCVLLHNGTSSFGTISCFTQCQFPKKTADVLKYLPVRKLIGTKSEQQDDKIDTQQREMEEEAYSLFKSEKVPGFGQFDSLLIICKNVDACSVLDKTFNAVRSSGTIVIYSADSAVISLARTYLEQRACVLTNIRSSQCREIQVLKHRTHPLMQHIIPGGYILSGIRCFNP